MLAKFGSEIKSDLESCLAIVLNKAIPCRQPVPSKFKLYNTYLGSLYTECSKTKTIFSNKSNFMFFSLVFELKCYLKLSWLKYS